MSTQALDYAVPTALAVGLCALMLALFCLLFHLKPLRCFGAKGHITLKKMTPFEDEFKEKPEEIEAIEHELAETQLRELFTLVPNPDDPPKTKE